MGFLGYKCLLNISVYIDYRNYSNNLTYLMFITYITIYFIIITFNKSRDQCPISPCKRYQSWPLCNRYTKIVYNRSVYNNSFFIGKTAKIFYFFSQIIFSSVLLLWLEFVCEKIYLIFYSQTKHFDFLTFETLWTKVQTLCKGSVMWEKLPITHW